VDRTAPRVERMLYAGNNLDKARSNSQRRSSIGRGSGSPTGSGRVRGNPQNEGGQGRDDRRCTCRSCLTVPNSDTPKCPRRLAKQQQGPDGLMRARLAALWDEVAERIATKEGEVASEFTLGNGIQVSLLSRLLRPSIVRHRKSSPSISMRSNAHSVARGPLR
jgi:hypothetical protein